jgi:hypothetical protein
MLSDQVNPDGTPWDGCTRRESAEYTLIDESPCYCPTGFHLAHDYIIDLVAALNKQGLEVEHYYPELGHGLPGRPRSEPAARGIASFVSKSTALYETDVSHL